MIAGVESSRSAARTTLTFTTDLEPHLRPCHDRGINANVVDATHGETVKEILGGGDARVANQSFTLKQRPLTYFSAAGGQGAAIDACRCGSTTCAGRSSRGCSTPVRATGSS